MEPKKIFLLPGELCVSKEPMDISTILGSCVGVCLFNKRYNFGGMNHFMLPMTPVGETPNGKHGDYSTDLLIKMMLSEDGVVSNLEASILGGGNVTGHLSVGTGIGPRNIVIARDVVERYGIAVVNRNIGGDHGRKVYFKSWTGELDVRKIEKSDYTQKMEVKHQAFAQRKIKVLVVDDSATVRMILSNVIESDPGLQVVGQAANPYEARELLLEHDPDVICLDIIMPKMDGITFLKKLFAYKPKPVVIVSTVAQENSKLRAQAERIGAISVVDKEQLKIYEGEELARSILIPKLKAAAAVLVRQKSAEELEGL